MSDRFKNKKIAVIGAGTEGQSSALFLAKKGAKVWVLDQKKKGELDQKSIKILREKDIKILCGRNYLDDLNKLDLVVRSPGIRIQNLESRIKNKEITSQTKIFFDLCPCKIIGITGTKGKGTTSALIYEMFKKQGLDAYLGGNIGRPPLGFLDKLNPQSIMVLELSSFQLQDLTRSPHIAVMLMTTSEHLDYHKNTEEYVRAKRNILKFQTAGDFAILNKDYPASRESDIHTNAKMFYVSRDNKVEEGCFVEDGKIIVRLDFSDLPRLSDDARSSFSKSSTTLRSLNERRHPSLKFNQSKSTSPFSSSESGQIIEIELMDTKKILLPGEHNLENVCAAVMASILSGVSKENIVKVLKTFKGLEHRLELVAEINGVRFYDDSFSTIPETTIAAILAFKEPEILILGGSSKNSDFTELGRVISDSKNIKAIIGIGLEWPKIKLKIKNEKLKIVEGLKTMKDIVKTVFELAEAGDVVLLSPACASFDMFKNYKDRGDQFKREVSKLPVRN